MIKVQSFKNFIMEQEEINDTEQECLNLIKNIAETYYTFEEDTTNNNTNDIILNVILDYYTDNINVLPLEELHQEIEQVLLDEAIGSIVAGVVHGTGGERRYYAKMASDVERTKSRQKDDPKLYVKKTISSNTGGPDIIRHDPLYAEKQRLHNKNLSTGAYGSGIAGRFRRRRAENDIAKTRKRFEKAKSAVNIKTAKADSAFEVLRQKEKKHGRLAYKIDRALRPTNIVRGIAKGIAWAAKKIIKKPHYTSSYTRKQHLGHRGYTYH